MKNNILESTAIYLIIFFGIFGNYISNLIDLQKIHYVFILLGFMYFIIRNRLKYQLIVGFLSLLIFFNSETTYGFLSAMQTVVIPIILLSYSSFKDLSSLNSAVLAAFTITFIGIFLEFYGFLKFPTNGFLIGDIVYSRYAGFAGSPLAAGFIAALTIPHIFRGSFLKRLILILLIIFVLVLARSRGADLALLITLLTIFTFVIREKKYRIHFYVAILFILIASIWILDSVMSGSLLDWSVDKGNMGRIRQWHYCVGQLINNPISGIGAGELSPISESYTGSIFIDDKLGVVRSCESTYLKIFAENGVILGSLYLIFSIIILKRVYTVLRHKIDCSISSEIFTVSFFVIYIFILQIYNQTLDSPWMALIFFLSIRYILSQSRFSKLN